MWRRSRNENLSGLYPAEEWSNAYQFDFVLTKEQIFQSRKSRSQGAKSKIAKKHCFKMFFCTTFFFYLKGGRVGCSAWTLFFFSKKGGSTLSFFSKKGHPLFLLRFQQSCRQPQSGQLRHPSTPALRTWRSDLASTAERMSVKRFDKVIRLDKVPAVQRGRHSRPSTRRDIDFVERPGGKAEKRVQSGLHFLFHKKKF